MRDVGVLYDRQVWFTRSAAPWVWSTHTHGSNDQFSANVDRMPHVYLVRPCVDVRVVFLYAAVVYFFWL